MRVFTFLKENDSIKKGHKSGVQRFERETERGFDGVLSFAESERVSNRDVDDVGHRFDNNNR